MTNRNFALLLGVLVMALTCAAKEPLGPQVVDLTASDGTKLKASYFSAAKPGPGVLLLHQCDHERKIWDGLAQQLAAAGFNVLTFDLRGFGDSGGQPHNTAKVGPIEPPDEMQNWPGDIDVAFQYLKSQPGVKPDALGLGGASCGVDNAIKAAMRHSDVKSLVLLAGPTDLKGREFLRQTSLPVFYAVADDDQYPFMVEFTEWLYLITPNGKKFAHYQTGHHGAEIFSVHPDLPKAIVDWYVTTLVKTPGRAPVDAGAPAIPDAIHTLDVLEQPDGPARLTQKLTDARQKDPKAPFLQQQMLDHLANEHVAAGDTKQALEIAKLDVFAYPTSPVGYGVLCEAYLAQGQKDLARQNAQKALEVLPQDTAYPQNVHDAIKAGLEQILKRIDSAQ